MYEPSGMLANLLAFCEARLENQANPCAPDACPVCLARRSVGARRPVLAQSSRTVEGSSGVGSRKSVPSQFSAKQQEVSRLVWPRRAPSTANFCVSPTSAPRFVVCFGAVGPGQAAVLLR
jgi:hypothetical protein